MQHTASDGWSAEVLVYAVEKVSDEDKRGTTDGRLIVVRVWAKTQKVFRLEQGP